MHDRNPLLLPEIQCTSRPRITANTPSDLLSTSLLDPNAHELVRVLPGQLSKDDFLRHLSAGIPILVDAMDSRLQGGWSPDHFAILSGRHRLECLDSSDPEERIVMIPAAKFFNWLKGIDLPDKSYKIKVLDPVSLPWSLS